MIIGQIRMFCGLVGEPSYIAAAEPYYEVETDFLFNLAVNVSTSMCITAIFCQGPFGDWHSERLCNATDFLKDGQLEYQEYQVLP